MTRFDAVDAKSIRIRRELRLPDANIPAFSRDRTRMSLREPVDDDQERWVYHDIANLGAFVVHRMPGRWVDVRRPGLAGPDSSDYYRAPRNNHPPFLTRAGRQFTFHKNTGSRATRSPAQIP